MKKIFLYFFFAIVSFNGFSQGIYFEENLTLETVFLKARKDNKFVFIDFYTPWCGPCKMMSRDIFPQKIIGDFFNSHFVNISLNGDAVENKSLVEKYVIISYPAYVFLNSQGEVIHRGIDGMTADEFIQLGKTAVDSTANFKSIAEKIKNGNRNPELLQKYFDFIPYNDEKEALTIEYLNQLTEEEKLSDTAWCLFRDYVHDVRSTPFLYFAKNTIVFIRQFGNEKVEKKMLNTFQNSYHEEKDFFNSLKKHNPELYKQVEIKLLNSNP